jgi:hypothetical protein
MLNCEKSILVVYVNVENLGREKGIMLLTHIRDNIKSQFINEKEINDDSLVIIVMPSNKMEVQLLNARYPDYKSIIESSEKIINDYLNENLKK